MAIGVRKTPPPEKAKTTISNSSQVVVNGRGGQAISLLDDMVGKRHFERLNEFKLANEANELDDNIITLKNSPDFYDKFQEIDKIWGGNVLFFLPRYKGVFEGREENLEALRDTVSDLNLPTQIVVGEAGRGKTTLVRKFLELTNTGEITNKMGFELIGIEVSLISAYKNGNNDFIGILGAVIPQVKELERLAQKVLNKPNIRVLLFIDEIHGISKLVQLPNGESAGVDVIKPVIYPSIDGLIVVGATTAEEYDNYIAPNAPFLERFVRKTTLKPFSDNVMKKIVVGHWDYLRNVRGVKGGIDDEVVDYVIDVNSTYNTQHAEPRKSKDFLSMLESYSFNEGVEPDIDMVRYIFKRDKDFTPDKKFSVKDIMTLFNERIYGQFMAKLTIEKVLRARDGAMKGDRGKTLLSYLAVGPTGVGKTEGARVLTQAIYGKTLEPIVASVNDYAQRTNGVNDLMKFIASGLTIDNDRPIILDEVEKGFISKERPQVASPMADAFLTIFGEGKLKWVNEYGQEFTKDLKSNIIVATTNAGFSVYESRDKNDPRKITVNTPKPKLNNLIKGLTKEIEETIKEKDGFTPELLGRLDGIVCYESLTEVDAIGIIENKLKKYQDYLLSEYHIHLRLGKVQRYRHTRISGIDKGKDIEAYPVSVALATVLANMTDSSAGGARQVNNIFKNNVYGLVSYMKDEGTFTKGDVMELYVQAIDRTTGEDITDYGKCEKVKLMQENYNEEEIRIGIKKIQTSSIS